LSKFTVDLLLERIGGKGTPEKAGRNERADCNVIPGELQLSKNGGVHMDVWCLHAILIHKKRAIPGGQFSDPDHR